MKQKLLLTFLLAVTMVFLGNTGCEPPDPPVPPDPDVKYTISVSASPSAGGTVTGGGTYSEGVSVTVKATANDGYEFISWTDEETIVSMDADYTFTVTENRTLAANFEEEIPDDPTGTLTDPRDGNVYKTVKIGKGTWMAANLNYDTDGSFCYDDDPSCDTFGRLYLYTPETAATACPPGWHLLTEGEWTYMVYTIFSGPTEAGGKLKETGTVEEGTGLWHSPNTGATNEVGFTALPGGRRHTAGHFLDIGNYGYWWISGRKYTAISYNNSKTSVGFDYGDEAYSIRCVMDAVE